MRPLYRALTKEGKLVKGWYCEVFEGKSLIIRDKSILTHPRGFIYDFDEVIPESVGQSIGLYDKNGLTEIYEGDIIGVDGLKKGNQYENTDLLKDQSNLLIQRFGTATWETTNKKAMERGCKYSE